MEEPHESRCTGTASAPQRAILLELLHAALTAVDGRRCTREALRASDRRGARPVWAAAVGKAASSMTLGAADALGARLERVLLVTKDGHIDEEVRRLPDIEARESAHPVPDERSLAAGARLLAFIEDMPDTVQPLFLVSGGASSLVEALAPGITLSDLRRLNVAGLAHGIAIEALNARRREVSRIKGGRLAERLRGRRALALFISDVPGDDPAVIGSGLLGPGSAPDDLERVVIASIDDARRAVARRAAGLTTHVPSERFSGDAEYLAGSMAKTLAAGDYTLEVWGGESVLDLPAHPGRGGRNQHLALAAARHIAGRADLFLLAAGTDGTDGPTAEAGALVDGGTCARITQAGADAEDYLRRADSSTALALAGDLLRTGPTGTNVGDLVLGLKLPDAEAHAWRARADGPRADP